MTPPDHGHVTAFPLHRGCPFAPPPEYDRLRAAQPVARVPMVGGGTAWLVSGHHEARRMLADPGVSADRRRAGFPRLAPVTGAQRRDSFRDFRAPLNWMDPPEHAAARRLVIDEFTARRVNLLRPRITGIVDECLDAMVAGPRPVDLVRALAYPVPSRIICELLGVPYARHEFFEGRTTLMLSRGTPAPERTRCAREIRAMLDSVVTGKERDPADDLLSRLISKLRGRGAEDHEFVVSMAFVLLVAGHVTTSNMISLSVLALLEHPRQLARMLAEPTRIPAAVEELLRYLTIVVAATARIAVDDIEIGGVRIRAGEGVVALIQAANRDPAAFDDPGTLDIDRGARHHLAFGHGRHQCLGQNLARLELQVVLERLFRRLPGLRVAVPVAQLPLKVDANVHGLYRLPVTW
jgi:cytochrome P450